MAHTLLSDCYRDVGTGRAYETGQGDRVGSPESPVFPPHYTYLAPAFCLHSTVTSLALAKLHIAL